MYNINALLNPAFSHLPQILNMLCFLLLSTQNIQKCLWPMNYLEVFCKHSRYFHCPDVLLLLNPSSLTIWSENTLKITSNLLNWLSFVLFCRIWCILVFHVHWKITCILVLLVRCSVNINKVQLVEHAVQVSVFLNYFYLLYQ